MSKFKNNEKVVIKTTGKTGTIKNINVIRKDKHVDVQYLVQFDNEPMEKWQIFSKTDLLKIKNDQSKRTITIRRGNQIFVATKRHHFTRYCLDVHCNLKTLASSKYYNVYWTIGVASCHPEDEFNEEVGEKIARNYAKEEPIAIFTNMSYNLMKIKLEEYIQTLPSGSTNYEIRQDLCDKSTKITKEMQNNMEFINYISYLCR